MSICISTWCLSLRPVGLFSVVSGIWENICYSHCLSRQQEESLQINVLIKCRSISQFCNFPMMLSTFDLFLTCNWWFNGWCVLTSSLWHWHSVLCYLRSDVFSQPIISVSDGNICTESPTAKEFDGTCVHGLQLSNCFAELIKLWCSEAEKTTRGWMNWSLASVYLGGLGVGR